MINPIVTYDDIKEREQYKSSRKQKINLHIGQRKLFLSELQFLTNNLQSNTDFAHVVYAGAAAANSKYFMAQLFPNVKFIFVDPNEFRIFIEPFKPSTSYPLTHDCHQKITYIKKKNQTGNYTSADTDNPVSYINKTNYNFYIIEDFFTNDMADQFSTLKGPLYFWSDIRTASGEYALDLDIIHDSMLQYIWAIRIKCNAAMFKFKTPYFEDPTHFDNHKHKYKNIFDYTNTKLPKKYRINFEENYYNNKFIYPKGIIFIQSHAPASSTETRLVVDFNEPINLINYDHVEYDEKFFWFNNRFRQTTLVKNPAANEDTGFDHCNDCALEYHIWHEYYTKYQLSHNFTNNKQELLDIIESSVARLTWITHVNLNSRGHGELF